ncbi:actin-like ATPase domain-containing protein [Flammula alnicola]|nr:actin-like ATPase domain-containing protein [Flammula alnicola]
MRLTTYLSLLSLSALAWLPQFTQASVLAIDYGNDFIKASLMKPGVPFDVLLNKDSKRKISSVVAWKKGDRLFGQDAFNLASRFPSDTFSSLKLLQAAPFDTPIVSYYTEVSTADLAESARKTVSLKQSDNTEWAVEELVGMQFAYIKHLAELTANEKVTDFERDAIADAIEISGLRTLALINDGTAVAVNYAMTRTFPTPEHHIIYDAGASGIRATIASFTTPRRTHIAIAGVGYDRNNGGIELDRRLRGILEDIREDKRGMAKFDPECNTDATAQVESLAWDVDFKHKVTRAEFEEKCKDLVEHFAKPVEDALKNAGLTMDNITSVILTGGSTRTPMIQAALKAAIGEYVATSSAVLGAALHGASLSRQFKTKPIKVTDIAVHDIQASYFAAPSSSTSRPRIGTKKVLTFRRKEDFAIFLDYKNSVAPGFPTRMLEVELGNVTEAIANLTERGAVDPVVKATLTLSESGFVSVTDAVAFGEIKDESITGKLKGFFGAGSSSSDETTTDQQIMSLLGILNLPQHRHPLQLFRFRLALCSPEKKVTPVENTIPLTIEVKFTTIPPMTVDQKRSLGAGSLQPPREARNSFESYLYRLRDLLDEDNKDTPFKKCSQTKERQAIAEKLDESFAWLFDRGDLAETSQFLDKRIALETLEKPIIHRYQEIEAFPQALNNSQMWNWSTRLFLHEARQNLTAEIAADLPSKWTKEELDGLEKTLKEHEAWLSEWVEKQKDVKPNEDPVIETTEMKARAKVLEAHLQKLWKRKVPKAVKKPKPTSTSTTEVAKETGAEEPEGGEGAEEPVKAGTDDQQVPLREEEPAVLLGRDVGLWLMQDVRKYCIFDKYCY